MYSDKVIIKNHLGKIMSISPHHDAKRATKNLFRYATINRRFNWATTITACGATGSSGVNVSLGPFVRRDSHHTWTVRLKSNQCFTYTPHDDVIKWQHFPRYWPFVRGIQRSPVNSPHKDQWRGALMFSLICVWINGWVNNGEAGDLRRYRADYNVTAMFRQNSANALIRRVQINVVL